MSYIVLVGSFSFGYIFIDVFGSYVYGIIIRDIGFFFIVVFLS